MSNYQQKDNTGALFNKMKEKKSEKHPDYSGSITVNGQEYYLDGWINEPKGGGDKYLSLRMKPKMARQHQGGSQNPPVPNGNGSGAPF